VQLSHCRDVYSAAQLCECSERRGLFTLQSRADNSCRFVWRKKSLVIAQNDQIVASDESVRRITVNYIDRSGRKRLIFHCLSERPHTLERNAIGAAQSGEP